VNASEGASGGYREIFRRAGERWLDGDRGALDDFERGIAAALEEGDVPAALSAHQKLLAWAPADRERHSRVAVAIAAARDRQENAAAPGTGASLESIPLFSGVPKDELVSLLTAVEPVRVAAGEDAVREFEPGDSLFLVASGTLAVTTLGDAGPVEIGRLGPGDFFGEVSLLTEKPRTATVTAVTEAELLRLPRAAVAELRRRHPEIEASLREFHKRRAERTIEALLAKKRGGGA
jgi:hypothetical protein